MPGVFSVLGLFFFVEVAPMARSRVKPRRSRSALSSVDVLREQAVLIETQKLRLNRILAIEHDSGDHTPEARRNIELLMRMYESHLTAQQELGLEPAYLRDRRPKTEPSNSDGPSAYPYLPPDAAQRVVDIEQAVARGEIDLGALYEQVGEIFKVEQKYMSSKKEDTE